MEINLTDLLTVALPIGATSTTLAAMHWFPWHGGTRPLARTTAYMMGTAVVVGAPVATMVLTAALGVQYSSLFWAGLLVANTAVAGATVNLAYWIDQRRAISHADVTEVRDAETWG